MKTFRILLLGLMMSLLGIASSIHAEDIDIYSDNAASAGVPNVLFVLDNAANFSASAPSCSYVNDGTAGGTVPSLNGTAGGIEQCALYNVIKGLPEGSVNIGLMVYNDNGMRDFQGANCASANGGCLAQPLTLMSGAAKTAFLAWIKTWVTSGAGYNIKAAGKRTASTMQEAWAYYAGRQGMSGRNYTAPPAGCQKNFVIFIGNAFSTSGGAGDGGTASPDGALAAAPGVTEAQKAIITIPSGSYGTSAFSCGNYTMGNNHSDLYADEWARYMKQTDIYGGFDGNQSITTYTVGLLGPQCTPDYPALMTSMAKVGGGKYFATSSYDEIATAILKILNEIQAVNSVFSSASLPVSVNAQGTYLNQIFLGMFRPDASANPRWVGNLKQYQFILEHSDPTKPNPNTAKLKLGDSAGNAAISSAGTGFITPGAVSYWTKKDIGTAPDSSGGFFINDARGAGGAFDSPDGELVEKGGAAQQLRLNNLTVNYASTPSSPRRLYTYCPSGASCNASLTNSANAFATSNTAITDIMLGATVGVAVSTLTRTSTLATVTTGAAHGFLVGDSITISGAIQSDYNGTFPIANVSSNSFTYVMLATPSRSPATGTITAKKSGFSGRTALINWVRGEDNFGDELGPTDPPSPNPPYTVRPSVHGDVLHSRPVAINFGTDAAPRVVVFYGGNDGVFRAINGNQTVSITSGGDTVTPGGELWGLVLPEHYSKLNRQRVNSPELQLPSTPLGIGAQRKDYFVDGSPGVYQKLKSDGTVDKAYLYLTMRRGGRFIYALDVSIPTDPKVMWKISSSDAGFTELGQTWSRPRVTLVKGYTNPVLVFGAGYDPAEDAEPPTSGTMGRGIFVLDAVTGARVWSAAYTAGTTACSGSSTQAACAVSGMNWGIPADISFVDRDNDGKTDRFYAADLGGNVWRVDLEPTTGSPAGNTPDKWQVSKFAALGCATGSCPSGTTPRKFFFPPNVVSVGATGASGSYDVVLLGSGDREHPLKSTATGSSFNVENRFYALKDSNTGKDAASTIITEAGLFPGTSVANDGKLTSVPYDGTLSGFYTSFATGEKAVNASTTLRGTTFFGTNKPTPPSATSCSSNLGEAKGYALNPFTGGLTSTVYEGGGLPPSPTAGIVTIKLSDGTSVKKEFCVGCGGASASGSGVGGGCNSALEACTPGSAVAKNPRRNYWYKK